MGKNVACYCGAPAKLRRSKYGPFWSCSRYPACDGTVGCHPGTTRPLGSLADKATRTARKEAHEVFDELWRSGEMSRADAYDWLASKMGLPEVHMAEMDADQCAEVIEIVEERYV